MIAEPRSRASQEAARIAGDCYYEHTVTRSPAHPSLTGGIDADVTIVGGGFAGLSCAIELTERGLKVVVLEAARLGAAASGRNGGQLLPGYSCELDAFGPERGSDAQRRAWDLSVEGVAIVRERAGSDCDFTPGWLLLAARRGHVPELRAWYDRLVTDLGHGEHVEWVDRPALHKRTASAQYHAAILDRYAGHLNPVKLTLALERACVSQGCAIYENSLVTQVDPGSAPVVHTTTGMVRCRHVVIAANVFGDGLGLGLERNILSVGNTIIVTEPLAPELARSLIPGQQCASDTNFLLDYYRVTPDHRLLWGGASTYFKHDGASRVEGLRQKMALIYPELRDTRIEYAWGGLIDVTMSRAPDFGRLGDNILYLQGFSGHGLNVTAIAGRVAAEAICGQRERFDFLARLPHRAFPQGRIAGRAALLLGTWYYRGRDLLS